MQRFFIELGSKLIYISQSSGRYFYFYEDKKLPEGEYCVVDLEGKKYQVDKASVLPYEISRKEAHQYLNNELNNAAGRFLNAVREKTGNKTKEDSEADNFLKPEQAADTTRKGFGFFIDMGAFLKILWQASKSKDEASAADGREKLRKLREKLKAKGIPLKEDFEKIPEKLRKERLKKDRQADFEKSAARFEEELKRMKKSPWEAFKNTKESDL